MQQPVQLQLIASNWSQLNWRKKSKHVWSIEQWRSFAGSSHSDSSPTPKTVWSRSASAARRATSSIPPDARCISAAVPTRRARALALCSDCSSAALIRVIENPASEQELRTHGDQVIRENPASRGKPGETSAEVLVGPPWRMESNAGQQQWYGGYPCTPDGGPMGHSARSTVPPPPSASSVGVGRHRGSTWARQFSPP